MSDFLLQIITIAFCIIGIVSNKLDLYYAYFIVGAVQLLSMLAHEVTRCFIGDKARRFYHNLTYILVVCMMFAAVVQFTFFVFYLLLFAAPFMAFYYVWLCYRETFIYLKRPLSILK